MSKSRTYHYEQSVLFVLVLLAATLQIRLLEAEHQLTLWTVYCVAASSALIMLMQQVRSMANRQAEQNAVVGVKNAWMECSPKVASRALMVQILGTMLGFAQAPTWAHVLIVLFAVGYEPIWRRWYRNHYPLVSAPIKAGGSKSDTDMIIFIRGKSAFVSKDKIGMVGRTSLDEIPLDEIPLEDLIARLVTRR